MAATFDELYKEKEFLYRLIIFQSAVFTADVFYFFYYVFLKFGNNLSMNEKS